MEERKKIMDLAFLSGEILLCNGAEISRVEDTMTRIAKHYGVADCGFFVLSNGITATADNYAKTKFMPIKGSDLEKVVAVNQVSRDVSYKNLSLEELESTLMKIKDKKGKPFTEQVIASAVGSAAFCIIFGGSLIDCAAAAVAGLLLWVFMCLVGYRRLSRITGNVTGGLLATALCLLMYRLGFGENLNNMIIGAIIPLVPGVPFTNGIRDMANEDYISGSTRLLDALLIFFCISLGVAIAFMSDARIHGQMLDIGRLAVDEVTARFAIQMAAAFTGTVAFAVLFGTPRRFYAGCGLCGLAGWFLFIVLNRHTEMTTAEILLLSAALVTLTSMALSIYSKCPITVFIIAGIFPLVPGEGIFRTTYNIVSNNLPEALHSGFAALKAAVVIALGIVLVTEIKNTVFKKL